MLMPRATRRTPAILILLAATVFLVAALPALADTTVTFIDVGQGDAIWIHDTTGHDVLIDAGEARYSDLVLRALRDVPDLDVVVWTHAHADHIGGLPDVLEAKPVHQIYYNGYDYNSVTFNDLWDLIIGFKIPQNSARRGATYTWGECTATILHPDREYINVNNSSVVIKLTCGQVDFLLLGDAELEAENAMLGAGLPLEAEIIKLGHHGSNTSNHATFLNAVRPKVAVISVGAMNNYGHPSRVVLDRLADRGIRAYRTDQEGTVTIHTNGQSYWVVTERGPASLLLPIILRGAGSPRRPPTPIATPTSAPTSTPTPAPTADVDDTVYITNSGTKYHRDGCRYLDNSKRAISCADASAKGYTACSVCQPECP